MFWWVAAILALTIYLILDNAEKARRLQLPDGPSELWSDLASLSLPELGAAVVSRRRDPGFVVHPGNEARVHWATGKKRQTELCIVYIHGWSASPQVYKKRNLDSKNNIHTIRRQFVLQTFSTSLVVTGKYRCRSTNGRSSWRKSTGKLRLRGVCAMLWWRTLTKLISVLPPHRLSACRDTGRTVLPQGRPTQTVHAQGVSCSIVHALVAFFSLTPSMECRWCKLGDHLGDH